MKIFLLCIFCISVSYAKTLTIDPLDKAALLSFLADVKKQDHLILGFDVSKASVFEKENGKTYLINPNGQNLYVYDMDINNDEKNEYVIVDVNSGSMGISGILKVLVKLDLGLKEIDFAKIVSKSLWNDPTGDMSKFHLWLAHPAFTIRDSNVIISYLEKQPKLKFFEYLWIGDVFKKEIESYINKP